MFEEMQIEDKKKLLVVMTITDGYFGIKRKYPKISYYSNDKVLIDIFEYLMKSSFGIFPSYYGQNYVEYTKKNEIKKIYNEFLIFCKDVGKQSENISLRFLKKSSIKVIKASLRLAMSTEGSLSISRKINGAIRGKLGFACANPKLCQEWLQLFKMVDIRMIIGKDKNVYSGIHGLQSVAEDTILNFEKIGGFIDGVKVQRGLRFKNWDKNEVLSAYKNFINQKRNGRFNLYTKMTNKLFWEKIKKFAG